MSCRRHGYVLLDQLAVQKVLLNLLSNAVKFTPKGGTVTLKRIALNPPQNGYNCKIIVSDTGIGVSPDFLPKMFEPFTQEHPADAQHGLSPEVPVFFCHDAHSLILGEMAAGVAKGYRRVGGYIIGTGIGFGAVCDGELQADAKGCPVFGMYRKPYRGETIEDFASSRGVPRLYGEIIGVPTTMDSISEGYVSDSPILRSYHACHHLYEYRR